MKRAALFLLLAGCSGCPSSTPPASAQVIYDRLTDAGCMQATDGGFAAIQQELSSSGQPAWFSCLADGGTVAGCGGCPK